MKNTIYTTKLTYKKPLSFLTIIFCLCLIFSCEKFVDIDSPITEVITEDVFSSDATANAAIIGMYSNMFDNSSISTQLTRETSLASDELIDVSTQLPLGQFFNNGLTSDNSHVSRFWTQLYKLIFSANDAIEGLKISNRVSKNLKNQLMGEAYFMRAFCHFYLVSLWSDVPLVTSTDYRVNRLASRSPEVDVFQQIIDDLTESKSLLSEDYSFSGGERFRPNKFTASALLARVYLYTEAWENAETESTMVINHSAYELLSDLNAIFLENSREAIWQLQSFNNEGTNTHDGNIYIILQTPPTIVTLRDELADSFESNDDRKNHWIDSISDDSQTYYFAYKYKIRGANTTLPITEAMVFFRLAEQYLIRAEARANTGNISGAQADINMIRNRAGLPNTTATDQASLLLAIEKERKHELFTEGSHRWMDLKRTGRIDEVLGLVKPGWDPHDKLFPIPKDELTDNPNLTQNPGYN